MRRPADPPDGENFCRFIVAIKKKPDCSVFKANKTEQKWKKPVSISPPGGAYRPGKQTEADGKGNLKKGPKKSLTYPQAGSRRGCRHICHPLAKYHGGATVFATTTSAAQH